MAVLRQTRVLLADDHQVVTSGLLRLLEPHCATVGAVHSLPELWRVLYERCHDLVVLDLNFGRESSLASLPELRERFPDVAFVVLTAHGEALRAAALHAGAAGYVDKTKSPQVLIGMLHEVAERGRANSEEPSEAVPSGEVAELAGGLVTPRQAAVLRELLAGKSQQEAADTLQISLATVEFHLRAVRQRVGIRPMALLLDWARKELEP